MTGSIEFAWELEEALEAVLNDPQYPFVGVANREDYCPIAFTLETLGFRHPIVRYTFIDYGTLDERVTIRNSERLREFQYEIDNLEEGVSLTRHVPREVALAVWNRVKEEVR